MHLLSWMKRVFHRVGWFFRLCGMTLSMCWRGYVGYMGWSALVHGIGLVVGYLGDYAVIYTMMMNFPGLGEFSALDVCFLYAMGLTAYGLGNLHTREFWNMDEFVLRGKLDQFLIRPVSPLLQLFVQDIQVGYISHVTLGICSMMLIKGINQIQWGHHPLGDVYFFPYSRRNPDGWDFLGRHPAVFLVGKK